SCAYTDAISWASPSEPLPMLRDPRAVFDALFGAGATPEDRARRRREDTSVLDTIASALDRLKRQVGAADRARLADYLDDVREIDFQKINKYHVSLVSGFVERLKRTPDGDGNLLDNTLMVYGSPMGNPNVHNHKRCPLFIAGRAGGQIKGGRHIKAADGTPMANVFLSMAHFLGMNDLASFGDRT